MGATDELVRDLGLIELRMSGMGDSLEDIGERLGKLDDAIRGNGRVGLVTEMALVKTRVEAVEAFAGELRSYKRWFILGVLSFLGTTAWNIIQAFLAQSGGV